jgi:hypothetical protein
VHRVLHPQNATTSATVGAPAAAAFAAAKCSSPSPSRSPGDAASQRLRCPPSSDPPAPLSLLFSTPPHSSQASSSSTSTTGPHRFSTSASPSQADELRPDRFSASSTAGLGRSAPYDPAREIWAGGAKLPGRGGWSRAGEGEASARSRGGAPRRRPRDGTEVAPCSTSLLPKLAATSIQSWRPSSPWLARGPRRDPRPAVQNGEVTALIRSAEARGEVPLASRERWWRSTDRCRSGLSARGPASLPSSGRQRAVATSRASSCFPDRHPFLGLLLLLLQGARGSQLPRDDARGEALHCCRPCSFARCGLLHMAGFCGCATASCWR